ncbi:hypothetical protein BH753_gp032 [Bacillus phage Shbh1]|uniref:Uncharacterized protein n=1 Tax=Bacillus phage Shbh1 TaxID=1796992 RepID=A0A142F157_9CAUD|nr:hypothetical protein BH753_gp032 [Bacillus phage Shbh1]AMQ66514.1 hypothetical protein [Bacillus phage Shbh1]
MNQEEHLMSATDQGKFLLTLIKRKWDLYRYLYKNNPHASTSEECYRRINMKAKYEEICRVIDSLPSTQAFMVNQSFDEQLQHYLIQEQINYSKNKPKQP